MAPRTVHRRRRSRCIASLLLLALLGVLLVLQPSAGATPRAQNALHPHPPPLDAFADEDAAGALDDDSTEFVEMGAEVENVDQSSHIEDLLALQDKYSSPSAGSAIPALASESVMDAQDLEMDAALAASALGHHGLADHEPHPHGHQSLMETEQFSGQSVQDGVGMRVGTSAEVAAAIAAGVDMSSESQMEAQLEQLAEQQQSQNAAAESAAQQTQTANLLSFFWGKTPHKVWQDKADWQRKSHDAVFVQPHKFEFTPEEDKPAPQAHMPKLQPAPAQHAPAAAPAHPAQSPAQHADAAAATHKSLSQVSESVSASASAAPVLATVVAKRFEPDTSGTREVFWLSLGPKLFSWDGKEGSAYPFSKTHEARKACEAVGAVLATHSQLQTAYKAGAEWCACGAVSEGRWGFPMQHKRRGCGTGLGTNEVCSAGGATCFGYKPSKRDLKLLPSGAIIAPFRPGQWHEDRFASLSKKCRHGAPWSTKECLQPAWRIAGCSRRGTRYPSTQASTVLWNKMDSWSAVLADIQAIAKNDVPGGVATNQCKGVREVFWYARGPKRFIWNGQSGDGYPFNEVAEAEAACKSVGATLATKAQLAEAWRDGAEWCMCGALADAPVGRWSFPMHKIVKGCGSKVGIVNRCSAGGATCYGVKPAQGKVSGIIPFRPGQWHQDRWTPLAAKCAHEPPYSLEECLLPAWELAGCTKLGADYPTSSKSALVAKWNSMSWDSVREDMRERARSDPTSCRTKFAELDGACNHPPPYSTKRCLQRALTLAGCDKFGYIWPSSKSTKRDPSSASAKANIWWNTQDWATVVRDMQSWAHYDLVEQRDTHRGGCQGMKEVFWYSGGAKKATYAFVNAKEAAEACAGIGAQLATPAQLKAAYEGGAEWCAAGFTSDGNARYPVQKPRKGCASEAGVAVWKDATKGGATCYGFKPNPTKVSGLLPWSPHTRFSQVREWHITPVGNCTRSCGTGKQLRKVACVNPLNGKVRPDHTCRTLGPKPGPRARCNTQPCDFDWKKGAWGDCSVSCGGGKQERSLRCLQSSTGNEFPDAKCMREGENKPRTSRPCNSQSCISYRWKISSWGTCSKECAGGSQKRSVHCLGSDGKVHRDERCETANGKKPALKQACNTDECPTWEWHKAAWSECSLSCGAGKKTRKLTCVSSDKQVDLAGKKCAKAKKPRTEKPCNTEPCELYTWHRTKWSNCTRTCGGGSSSRDVSCRDSKGHKVAAAACASQGPMPRTVKSCNTIKCRNFNWFTEKWSDCSVSCDKGFQTRGVHCVGDDGSLATDLQCKDAGPKKESKQACNKHPCVTLYWVKPSAAASLMELTSEGRAHHYQQMSLAGGWSECSKKCGGGTRKRSFECRASDGTVRAASACEAVLGPMPPIEEVCNSQPCSTYQYEARAWSDCTLSCGGGLSTREVPCVSSEGEEVPLAKCVGQTRPSLQKACNTKSCEGFTWAVGAYSACDASCGGGLQKRSVTCKGTSGKTYKDSACAQVGYDKPATERACNTVKCVDKTWQIGEWDSCDRSCGTGTKTRTVQCVGTDKHFYSDADCLASYAARNASLTKAENVKPVTTLKCNTAPCVSFFWDTTAWSECSAKCGGGLQDRKVTCLSSDGKQQQDGVCTSLQAKPSNQQVCNTAPCPTYSVETSEWETCSTSCGGGMQTRTAVCKSSAGVRLDSTADEDKFAAVCPERPLLSRPCNTQACAADAEKGWQVGKWTTCDNKCGGGVQRRLVACESKADPTCASFGTKPISERKCNTHPCVAYTWATSEWSECSRSCGEGFQQRTVTCKGNDGSLHNADSKCAEAGAKPAAQKKCAQSACVSYSWQATAWSACSRSCGGGSSTRSVACVGSDGIKRADDTCANQGAKPEGVKACNSQACETHEFKIGEWEACSQGCGGGKQTRSVQCLSSTTQQSVDVKRCLKGEEVAPLSSRACNEKPCLTYYWQVGAFGACSDKCNGGFQTRAVTCMGSDGAKYKDDFCHTFSPKVSTQRACNTKPCGQFGWAPEPQWSSCTVSCDGGIQTRATRCVGPDGNTWPSAVCSNSTLKLGPKPAAQTQLCNTHACMTTMWDITPWSNCSKSCGLGEQARAVTCRKADGTIVPDSVCAQLTPKPKDTQGCNTNACPKYKWTAEEFDDCSVSCGTGVASRIVRCVNQKGSIVSNRHCFRSGVARPEASRVCNTQPCNGASSWVIDPWQQCSVDCGGGMRIRSVNCRASRNSTDKECKSILPMPLTQEPCNTHQCVTVRWEPTQWTECSKSCEDAATLALSNSTVSTAVQTRQLRCRASDGTIHPNSRCARLLAADPLPKTSRPCSGLAICPKFKWTYGKWSKCSKSCGGKGQQQRDVWCADDKNVRQKDNMCKYAGVRPRDHRACNTHKCVREYQWKKEPWTSCSHSCGPHGGEQTRKVRCVDRFRAAVTPQACELLIGSKPVDKKVCNKRPCKAYKWLIKPWSECSKWCGGGEQTRNVTCVAGDDGKLAKDIMCASSQGEKPAIKQKCNDKTCVRGKWKTAAAWSECSRSCGGGKRSRAVACVGGDGSVLPDKACSDDGPKPLSEGPCNAQRCLSTSWFIGTWSDCTKKCDGGVQTREVACVGSDGVVQPDINCAYAGKKAPKEQACNSTPCSAYVRKYTPWSDCTVSCGAGGTQTRKVSCWNSATKRESIFGDKCSHRPVEELQRVCNSQPCVTHQWKIGAWSKCSKECGGGAKKREVVCAGSDGSVVADSTCLLITAKPDTERACHSSPCSLESLFAWKLDDWSACSEVCGGGVQHRKIACTRKSNGEVVGESHCVSVKRPRSRRHCNTAACVSYFWHTGEWAQCTKRCGGGQAIRAVQCVESHNVSPVLDAFCNNAGQRPASAKGCNQHACVVAQKAPAPALPRPAAAAKPAAPKAAPLPKPVAAKPVAAAPKGARVLAAVSSQVTAKPAAAVKRSAAPKRSAAAAKKPQASRRKSSPAVPKKPKNLQEEALAEVLRRVKGTDLDPKFDGRDSAGRVRTKAVIAKRMLARTRMVTKLLREKLALARQEEARRLAALAARNERDEIRRAGRRGEITNEAAIKKLPVVPELLVEAGLDEYGDEQQDPDA